MRVDGFYRLKPAAYRFRAGGIEFRPLRVLGPKTPAKLRLLQANRISFSTSVVGSDPRLSVERLHGVQRLRSRGKIQREYPQSTAWDFDGV